MNDAKSEPTNQCQTDECYRQPTRLVSHVEYGTPIKDVEKWRCDACWNAILIGAGASARNEVETLKQC